MKWNVRILFSFLPHLVGCLVWEGHATNTCCCVAYSPRFENRGDAAPCLYPTIESGETFCQVLAGSSTIQRFDQNIRTCLTVKQMRFKAQKGVPGNYECKGNCESLVFLRRLGYSVSKSLKTCTERRQKGDSMRSKKGRDYRGGGERVCTIQHMEDKP